MKVQLNELASLYRKLNKLAKSHLLSNPNDYLYHVTRCGYLDSIASNGLNPNGGEITLGGRPGYEDWSQGKLFFSDHMSLAHWYDLVGQLANTSTPQFDGHVPIVLRVARSAFADLYPDAIGKRDAPMGDSFYTTSSIPQDAIEAWDGESWVAPSGWWSIDPEMGGWYTDNPDDPENPLFQIYLADDSPLFPRF